MQRSLITLLFSATMLQPLGAFAQDSEASSCDQLILVMDENQERYPDAMIMTREDAEGLQTAGDTAACDQALLDMQAAIARVELEEEGADQQAAGAAEPAADADQQQADAAGGEGEIVVRQAAPELRIEQDPPQVVVRQAEPNVNVRQPQPEITVHQPAPTITVDIPQPEIIIRMPRPEVDIAQAQPEVEVNQPAPRVELVAPEQEAEVQVEQAQTEVQVAGAQAQVQITEAEAPIVNYQREDPQIIVSEAEGQPSVRFEQMETPAEQAAAGEQPAAEGEQQVAAGEQPAAEADQQMAAAQPAAEGEQQMAAAPQAEGETETEEVTVGDIRGLVVYNSAGEEIGTIDQLMVRTEDNQGYAIIDHRGLKDFGEEMIAYPLAYLQKDGDKLFLLGMNDEQITAIPAWTPDDETFRAADDGDTAVVSVLVE